MPERRPIALSREALGRVVASLLDSELAAARGRGRAKLDTRTADLIGFAEGVSLSSDAPGDPGCDSLEQLQLAAAVNEMFHLHEWGEEQNLLSDDRLASWLDTIEAAWRAGVAQVTFMTSGSTGAPKRCTHALAHLAAEATFLASVFGDRRRIVAIVPSHHIYGFIFTALLAEQLGVPVWRAEHAGAGRLAETLEHGDLVVGFPDRWAAIERSLRVIPDGVVGVTSTAPCPAALIEALRAKGLCRMVEVYGSSETAGIALRSAPGDPYRLMPQWTWDPAAEDGPASLLHVSGWRAPMPDRIGRVGPDGFEVQGRHDGAVQVGGINVDPAAIATRLCGCQGVQAAAVRLMRPDEGVRLKAFVVPVSGRDSEGLRGRLVDWSNQTLSTAERPKAFTFGSSLPTSALGKAADW